MDDLENQAMLFYAVEANVIPYAATWLDARIATLTGPPDPAKQPWLCRYMREHPKG